MGWGSIGCYHATNPELSWRLPLALSCVPPLALLVGLFFVPGQYYPGGGVVIYLTVGRNASLSHLARQAGGGLEGSAKTTPRSVGPDPTGCPGRIHPDCATGRVRPGNPLLVLRNFQTTDLAEAGPVRHVPRVS